MKTPIAKPAFWVTNISAMNVSLADLALNIKAFSTVNLLDNKHYKYTLEQLIKSKESGSLFKKRNKIITRHEAPAKKELPKLNVRFESAIPSRGRSLLVIEEKEYEELRVSEEDQLKQDEIYAQENADLAEIDIQRSINSKKV